MNQTELVRRFMSSLYLPSNPYLWVGFQHGAFRARFWICGACGRSGSKSFNSPDLVSAMRAVVDHTSGSIVRP